MPWQHHNSTAAPWPWLHHYSMAVTNTAEVSKGMPHIMMPYAHCPAQGACNPLAAATSKFVMRPAAKHGANTQEGKGLARLLCTCTAHSLTEPDRTASAIYPTTHRRAIRARASANATQQVNQVQDQPGWTREAMSQGQKRRDTHARWVCVKTAVYVYVSSCVKQQ